MNMLDKQIIILRIGINKSIRNLKKGRYNWKVANYEFLKIKLDELEFKKSIKEFELKLIGGE